MSKSRPQLAPQYSHVLIYAVILGLAACATTPPPPPQPNPWTVIHAGLDRYRGHDARELVAVLGYADSQRFVMGDLILVWRTDTTAPVPNFNIQTTSGMVGSTPYFANTTESQPMYVRLYCTIEIAVDADGIFKTYHLDGQGGACWRYANALR